MNFFREIFSNHARGRLSKTLRVIVIGIRASVPTCTGFPSSPPNATTLTPMGNARSRATATSCRRSRRSSRDNASSGTCRRATKRSQNTCVSRLLRIVFIPGTGSALSRESAGDPGVFIRPIPDGNADAVLCCNTGCHGTRVVCLLLRKKGVCRWKRHANIKLSNGNLNSEGSICSHGASLRALTGRASYNEVGLQTDAVDFDSVRFNELHDVQGTCCLGARILDIVVVVIEFHVWVCRCRCRKGNWEVGRADRCVPDTFAVGAVLIESYMEEFNISFIPNKKMRVPYLRSPHPMRSNLPCSGSQH